MDTRQVVARFEQERQALALMDHPNIARVLDAGATDTGRPYFVMDLVKGDPIGEYCDKNHLTIDERLELFAQVCQAVQHAHGKGIIHRDLKPSNILVGTQDGRPLAKVIDFGIAKATSAKLTDKTLFTEHQQVIGTLQYMSPEQVEGSLDIDTRSDVYSLGVLLNELLTGSTSFDKKTLADAMYSEIQRMIREVEPPKPSTRIHESRDTLASICSQRRTEPKRLGSLVRGELDGIVMKALEKDRARRYETANGLAMDIRRFLAGEAVVAAPPSAAYRLKKIVHRHKATVVAAAAVAVALLLGAVGFAWQAHEAGIERDAAIVARHAEQEERNKASSLAESEAKLRVVAENHEQKAVAINQFLLDMLGSANVRELGREVKVAQALDKAAAGVGKAFAERKEVEAAIRQILGSTYLSLGMLDQAETQIAAALELDRQHQGEGSAEFAVSLRDHAMLAFERGKLAAAVGEFGRSCALLAKTKGKEDLTTLTAQVGYANALVKADRNAEAEQILRLVLEIRTRKYGRETPDAQVVVNSLAVLLHNQERLDEAEPLYREAAETGRRVFGKEHPDTLVAQMNLASFLRSRRKLTEAEPLMARSYAGIKKVFGESHQKTAKAASVLAGLYADLGRYRDALPLNEECVAILSRAEGEQSPAVALAKQTLSRSLSRIGDNARAAAVQREAVVAFTANFGAEARETLNCRLDLANMLDKVEHKAEVEAMLKELLEAVPRALGEDHQLSIIATNSYGVFLMSQERYAEAEPYVRKALGIGRRVEGKDHVNTIVSQYNLTAILRELGRLDEAESLGRDTIERFTRALGPQHPNVATAKGDHGETQIKLGHPDVAKHELEEAIAITKAALGDQSPGFAGHALLLGRLLLDGGEAEKGELILREALAVQTKAR